MAEEQDPPKKTATQMLMEMLETPEIDRIKNIAIVYQDDEGICVKGGHRDKFEVIGLLEYGKLIIFETSHEKKTI